MGVRRPVAGDGDVAPLAGERRTGVVAGAQLELVGADALDDDLVEPDGRDLDRADRLAGGRRSDRGATAGGPGGAAGGGLAAGGASRAFAGAGRAAIRAARPVAPGGSVFASSPRSTDWLCASKIPVPQSPNAVKSRTRMPAAKRVRPAVRPAPRSTWGR